MIYLVIATVFALLAGLFGLRRLGIDSDKPSRLPLVFMAATFLTQLAFLYFRGQERGQCPLKDLGEIFAFLSWSLVLFYLITGPLYRVSLLGLFTAPLVVILQSLALLPGFLSKDISPPTTLDPWGETHAAFSVLAYGALGLSAIASVMFIILNQRLKEANFSSGLTQKLPGVGPLSSVMQRLGLIGFTLLTVGIVSGFFIENIGGGQKHLYVAAITWLLYALLLGISLTRGLTPKRLAIGLTTLFLASFLTFGLI